MNCWCNFLCELVVIDYSMLVSLYVSKCFSYTGISTCIKKKVSYNVSVLAKSLSVA